MKSAVSAAEAEQHQPEERRGDAPGALALALLEQVAEDRDERRRERGVRDERADQVRDLERDRERVDRARERRSSTSRRSRARARATRETPVASAKIAVETAEPPAASSAIASSAAAEAWPAAQRIGDPQSAARGRVDARCAHAAAAPVPTPGAPRPRHEHRERSAGSGARAERNDRSATIVAPAGAGFSSTMPNIKQQKKRVRIAAEERLENLRYRSTIKTLTKRLATAVEEGDARRSRRSTGASSS